MSEHRDQFEPAESASQGVVGSDAGEAPRMRFKGIVEAKSHETSQTSGEYAIGPIFRN